MKIETPNDYLFKESPIAARMTEVRTLFSEGRFALDRFKPGTLVLDAGCGSGAITMGIAELVQPGRVIGIDIDAKALSKASQVAQGSKLTNIEFQKVDLTQHPLPFRDAMFGGVWMHAVLYHLAEREACLNEILRILKPGGFVALRDSFYSGNVVYPANELVLRAFELTQQLLRSRGADPDLGPHHREILGASGFSHVVVTASYENFSEEAGDLGEYVRRIHVPFLREPEKREEIIQKGYATEAELTAIEKALLEWGAGSSGVFLRCRCEALGWKPCNK
jgi:ubiquinone/menaquinone biosynthesis C-methylase UbiE